MRAFEVKLNLGRGMGRKANSDCGKPNLKSA